MGLWGRTEAVGAILLALLLSPAAARGSEPSPLRSPAFVVQDLLGPDWKAKKAAREEALRHGARVLPRLLEARAAAPLEHDRRAPLDDVLGAVVQGLAVEVLRPLADPSSRPAVLGALGGVLGACRDRPDDAFATIEGELGDEGSIDAPEPTEWAVRRQRARRARGALLKLGPAVTGPLLQVPPVRDADEERALSVVTGRIWEVERELALAADQPAEREAFRARYRGILDLAWPILLLGLVDREAGVRACFQELRDQALAESLPALAAEDPDVRRAAEDQLFALGPVAAPWLLRVAKGEDRENSSAHAKDAATRLGRRIRWGLSRELIRRLGDDLAGYESLPFRGRRERVLELERLGGVEAIPALRALLREEASDEIRIAVAIALYRLGDPEGAEWLALNRAQVPLVRLSRRELSAIFMDQGLRNLQLGRFEQAEREFKQVLELEPQNETAWYNLACTYARWGKLDPALEHLQKAVEHGFDDATHMEKDPDLDSLRQDPRFRALLDGLRARGGGE